MTLSLFPASSKLTLDRSSSRQKRSKQPGLLTSRRSLSLGKHGRATHSTSEQDGVPYPAPSNINWRPQPPQIKTATHSNPPSSSTPQRPPQAHLAKRSASLSAIPDRTTQVYAPPVLLSSKRSLQLDMSASLRDGTVGGPASRFVQALSPIYEQHSASSRSTHKSSSAHEAPNQEPEAEPTTPASAVSTYSAFLHRPVKHSLSQASSTSSVYTPRTPIGPPAPTLPPFHFPPLDLPPRRVPVSTVYEDASSERTGSYVTARSDDERAELISISPDHYAPPLSVTMTDRTLIDPCPEPSISISLDTVAAGPPDVADVDIRPGSGDTFIMRRWGTVLSGVWDVKNEVQPVADGEHRWWRPSRPALLFWLGFIAPFCWLIGGWLVREGRWDMHRLPPRKRPLLPLWQGANGSFLGSAGNEVALDTTASRYAALGRRWRALWGAPRRPWLEERGKGKRRLQVPDDPWHVRWEEFAARGVSEDKRMPLSHVLLFQGGPEAWVLRCRVAAMVSGVLLLIAFVVALAFAVHLLRP